MGRPRKLLTGQNGSVTSGSVQNGGLENGSRNGFKTPSPNPKRRPRKSTIPEEDDGFVFKRKTKAGSGGGNGNGNGKERVGKEGGRVRSEEAYDNDNVNQHAIANSTVSKSTSNRSKKNNIRASSTPIAGGEIHDEILPQEGEGGGGNKLLAKKISTTTQLKSQPQVNKFQSTFTNSHGNTQQLLSQSSNSAINKSSQPQAQLQPQPPSQLLSLPTNLDKRKFDGDATNSHVSKTRKLQKDDRKLQSTTNQQPDSQHTNQPPPNLSPNSTFDNSYITTTSQVNLQDEETPTIRRNQQLRNQSNTGKRRSSLTNRGKRLSNIGNGFIGDPHADIHPKEFSKHLHENLSDPQKLKQLLVWCLKRNLNIHGEKLKQKRNESVNSTEELTALTIARHIEEEILTDLVDGKIPIDWHERPPEGSLEPVKRVPNSLNIAAKNNLEAFQKRLVELKQEEAMLIKNLELVKSSSLSKEKMNSIRAEFINQLDPSIKNLYLNPPSSSPSIQLQSFRENLPNLEVGVARLYDGIHKIQSLAKASSIFIDKTMNELTEATDVGSSTSVSETTSTNIDSTTTPAVSSLSPYDILRALSRLES